MYDEDHDTEMEAAKDLFNNMAAGYLITAVNKVVEAGKAEWMLDPQVKDVVGVIKKGTNRAVVVVYLGEYKDFEVDEELLEELLAPPKFGTTPIDWEDIDV